MNAETSFKFPFEDKEWLSKLGLGAVISLIPILNIAWSGYMVEIIRNVMNGRPEPLPTWDNFDKKFNEGLILSVAFLVYAAPILIALCLPLGLTASSGVISSNGNLEELSRRLSETGGILFFCFASLLIVYVLVLSVFYPVILVLFSREGTFASCFKLREAMELIRRNATLFFTAWGLSLLASLGVGLLVGFVNLVFGFIPCLGWIIGFALSLVAGVYASAVYAHLFGQFGRAALEPERVLPVT